MSHKPRRFATLRSFVIPALCAASAVLLSGCSDAAAPCNPRALLAAVEVEIRDVSTDSPLAEAARGAIHDGSYVDSLQPGRREGTVLLSRVAGYERPGTYTVEVVAPGYATWQQADVVVAQTACRVESVRLVALLQPSS